MLSLPAIIQPRIIYSRSAPDPSTWVLSYHTNIYDRAGRRPWLMTRQRVLLQPAVISTRGSIAENQPICYDQDATSTRTRERASIHILRFTFYVLDMRRTSHARSSDRIRRPHRRRQGAARRAQRHAPRRSGRGGDQGRGRAGARPRSERDRRRDP